MRLLLVGLIATGFCFGVEPVEKEFGSIDSGTTIPHYATGDGVWSTEFRIWNLERLPQGIELRFFDSDGNEQVLGIWEGNRFIGDVVGITGTIAPGGVAIIGTRPNGPLRVGYAELNSEAFLEIGMDAVITNGANFRTSVPGLARFQDHLRFPFTNSQGSVSCIAWRSDAQQNVTIIARDGDGNELCRDSKLLADNQHEAFCLSDRLPCVSGRDGLIEIITDFVGLTAISLTSDPLGRLWTTVPQSICCFNPTR